MEFKEMSIHMTEEEINFVLKIVYPHANLAKYNKVKVSNYITVYFYDYFTSELRQVDFLPDDIYTYDCKDSEALDGEPMSMGETLYQYKQFMIARGYSEIWLNNPYVCEKLLG